MLVNLKVDVQSYNADIQRSSVTSICDLIESIVGSKPKLSYLPTKRKVWTVNRSPHIFKKSREQFEQRKYKTCIAFSCNGLDRSLEVLNVLYSQEFAGIGLKAHVEFNTPVPMHYANA